MISLAPARPRTPDDGPHVEWGAKGHALINQVAAAALPASMPDFFKHAGDTLGALGSQPDRWKIRGLSLLGDVNSSNHYVNVERIQDRDFPATRSAYFELLVTQGLAGAGHAASTVGFLPYAIGECYEMLLADAALWRRETTAHGTETPLAKALEMDAVRTAGIMGHYVADASQPLHTTVHHDGWDDSVEPNPDGFSTEPGIHSRFETQYVNKNVSNADVAKQVGAARVLEDKPLDLALALVQDSHRFVRTVYQLDKAHQLNPSKPTPQATDLVVSRLAAGASTLRDLWFTAWTQSEDLATHLPTPPS